MKTLQKRLLMILLSVVAASAVGQQYSGGDGVNTPYQIADVDDWLELIATEADWDKHFIQTDDIDFQGAVIPGATTVSAVCAD